MPIDDTCIDNLDDALDAISTEIRKAKASGQGFMVNNYNYLRAAVRAKKNVEDTYIPELQSVIDSCRKE